MTVMKSTINIKSDLVVHEQLCKEFYFYLEIWHQFANTTELKRNGLIFLRAFFEAPKEAVKCFKKEIYCTNLHGICSTVRNSLIQQS